MRTLDIAVFMAIFFVVSNTILTYYAAYFGFKEIELLKLDINEVKEFDAKTQEMWGKVQSFATTAILLGTVTGAFLSAVFGQYYLSILIAVAGVVINFIPYLKGFMTALPVVLIAMGIPTGIAYILVTIFNFLFFLTLLIWLTGRGM